MKYTNKQTNKKEEPQKAEIKNEKIESNELPENIEKIIKNAKFYFYLHSAGSPVEYNDNWGTETTNDYVRFSKWYEWSATELTNKYNKEATSIYEFSKTEILMYPPKREVHTAIIYRQINKQNTVSFIFRNSWMTDGGNRFNPAVLNIEVESQEQADTIINYTKTYPEKYLTILKKFLPEKDCTNINKNIFKYLDLTTVQLIDEKNNLDETLEFDKDPLLKEQKTEEAKNILKKDYISLDELLKKISLDRLKWRKIYYERIPGNNKITTEWSTEYDRRIVSVIDIDTYKTSIETKIPHMNTSWKNVFKLTKIDTIHEIDKWYCRIRCVPEDSLFREFESKIPFITIQAKQSEVFFKISDILDLIGDGGK